MLSSLANFFFLTSGYLFLVLVCSLDIDFCYMVLINWPSVVLLFIQWLVQQREQTRWSLLVQFQCRSQAGESLPHSSPLSYHVNHIQSFTESLKISTLFNIVLLSFYFFKRKLLCLLPFNAASSISSIHRISKNLNFIILKKDWLTVSIHDWVL